MEVGGFHDPQVGLVGGRHGGEGVESAERGDGAGGLQQGAAVEVEGWRGAHDGLSGDCGDAVFLDPKVIA